MVKVAGGSSMVQNLMSMFGGGKSSAKLGASKASEALADGLKAGGVASRKPSTGVDQTKRIPTAYRTSGTVPISQAIGNKVKGLLAQSHTSSNSATSSSAARASSSSSSTSFAGNRTDLPLGGGGGGSGGGGITGLNLTGRLSQFAPGTSTSSSSAVSGGSSSSSSISSGSSSSSSVSGQSGSSGGSGGVSGHEYGSNVRNLRGMFESGAANNATGAPSGGGADDAAGVIRGGTVEGARGTIGGIFDRSSDSGGVQGGRISPSSETGGGVSNSPREAARHTPEGIVQQRAGAFGGISGSGDGVDAASNTDSSSSSSSSSADNVDDIRGPGAGGGTSASPGARAARLATQHVDVLGTTGLFEGGALANQAVDSPGRRDAQEATQGVNVAGLRGMFESDTTDGSTGTSGPVAVSALIEKARAHEAAASSPLAEPQTSSVDTSATTSSGVNSSSSTDDGPILSSANFVDGPFFNDSSTMAGGVDAASGTDASSSGIGSDSVDGSTATSSSSAAGFDAVDGTQSSSSSSGVNTDPYADGPYGPGTEDPSGLSREGLRMLADDVLGAMESGDQVDGLRFEDQAGGHSSNTGTVDGTNLAVQTGLDEPTTGLYTMLNDMGTWMSDPSASEDNAPEPLRGGDPTVLRGILGNRAATASVLPIPLGQRGDAVIIENPNPGPRTTKIPFRVVFGNTEINKDFGPRGSKDDGQGGEGGGGVNPNKGVRKWLSRFALPMGNNGGVAGVGTGGGGNTTVVRGGGGTIYTDDLSSVGGNSTIITGGGGGGGVNFIHSVGGGQGNRLMIAGGTGTSPLILFADGLTNLNREQLVHLHGQLGALMSTVEILPIAMLGAELQITMPGPGEDGMPRALLADVGTVVDESTASKEDIDRMRNDMTSGIQQLANQVSVALNGGGSLDSLSIGDGGEGPSQRAESSV